MQLQHGVCWFFLVVQSKLMHIAIENLRKLTNSPKSTKNWPKRESHLKSMTNLANFLNSTTNWMKLENHPNSTTNWAKLENHPNSTKNWPIFEKFIKIPFDRFQQDLPASHGRCRWHLHVNSENVLFFNAIIVNETEICSKLHCVFFLLRRNWNRKEIELNFFKAFNARSTYKQMIRTKLCAGFGVLCCEFVNCKQSRQYNVSSSAL